MRGHVAAVVASLVLAQPAPAPREPEVLVVVAARDLPAGHVLTDDDVVGVWMPVHLAPDADLPDGIGGRVVAERILKNEPLLWTRLADATGGRGVHALVPPGQRGVILPVQQRLQGFVRRGTELDVLVTVTRADGTRSTVQVASCAPVIAAGPDAALVAAWPSDAERLVHATAKGEIVVGICRYPDLPEIEPRGKRPMYWTGE